MIIVNDVHLPDRNDSGEGYPKEVFHSAVRVRKCEVCTTENAKFMSEDDPIIKKPVTFLCSRCLNQLHYD